MPEGEYSVGFVNERARKEFYKVLSKASHKDRERILAWFDKLALEPRPAGKNFKFLKMELPIFQRMAQYRVREGDWRILYDIDDSNRRVSILALRRRDSQTYQ